MIPAIVAGLLLTAQSFSSHPVLGVLMTPRSAPSLLAVGTPRTLGPIISAASAIVLDVDSGAVRFGKRPAAVRPLASLTKLVGALVVVREEPAWDREVTIIAEDLPTEGKTILAPGDRVTIADLLSAMLIGSDNASANALARTVGESPHTFRANITRMVTALDLPTIRVVDPTGLDPGNVGSARDIARLLRAALMEPEIRARLSRAHVTIDAHREGRRALAVRTTNLLLLRDGARHAFRIAGGKTGYTDEAGFNLAVEVERDGRRVIVVVLGSATHDDRFRDARLLADWALDRDAP